MEDNTGEIYSFRRVLMPILFFLLLLVYGLFVHPVFLKGKMFPLEILILLAFSFNIFYLFSLGFDWKSIEKSLTNKVKESIPVVFILLSIGVLIGSWMVSGTIPMLIHFGISIIDPNWIYVFSFLICIVFSMLTGTSWGSAGTIGVVMMGIAAIFEVDLGITAGAVVGGSFFGDKMSPLSDTTNIASLATNVPLMEHIKSMMYTTIPSALIAIIIYAFLTPNISSDGQEMSQNISLAMSDLTSIFNFNIWLLIPLVIVVWGSVKQKPIVIILLTSSWIAIVLAMFFQDFSVDQIFRSLNKGFSIEMIAADIRIKSDVVNILNRGGLYNLIEGVVVCLLIFAYIGTLDVINAIEVCIAPLMKRLKSIRTTIVASLSSTLITNITTSNQYATSFIIGKSFEKKYNELNIPRKVLSRSIEDAGTMMENLFPWTPSGIFMAATLGISTWEYAQHQYLSLINIVIALIFALTGTACFLPKNKDEANR